MVDINSNGEPKRPLIQSNPNIHLRPGSTADGRAVAPRSAAGHGGLDRLPCTLLCNSSTPKEPYTPSLSKNYMETPNVIQGPLAVLSGDRLSGCVIAVHLETEYGSSVRAYLCAFAPCSHHMLIAPTFGHPASHSTSARGPNDHVSIRIPHPGSKTQYEGDTKTHAV